MEQHSQEPSKKPYKNPVLTVYGDLRKITEGTGTNKFDNGHDASMGRT